MIAQIQREIKRVLAKLQFFAIGKVAKIDFKNYMVKAEILTTGMITNWLRIGEGYVGDGFGEAKAPNIGDEILICFPDGDPSGQGVVIRRLYGKDRPPEITEDEIILHHKSGTKVTIRKNGDVVLGSPVDQIVLDSQGIKIGSENAEQALVLGIQLLSWLNSHTHTSASSGAPTSPPIAPATQTLLSQRHKTE